MAPNAIPKSVGDSGYVKVSQIDPSSCLAPTEAREEPNADVLLPGYSPYVLRGYPETGGCVPRGITISNPDDHIWEALNANRESVPTQG